ncbi:SpoIIE family protein phosphatase [Streptomyces sp. enrichment culture]|uniref:SpoIIE family protein phosphatase n=1 Tax=Streptomyces sp. enrichment culture TaxID=1795815 RepID=UPI003F560FDD
MDEPRVPTDGDASDVVARARAVARLRARVDELEERLATSVLRERAKGALMAREGLSARQADAALARRAEERGRTVADECWAVLGTTRKNRAGKAVGRAPGTAGPSGAVPSAGAAPDVLARVLLEVLRGPAGVAGVLVCGAAPDGGAVLLGHAGVDGPPDTGPASAAVRGGLPVWPEEAPGADDDGDHHRGGSGSGSGTADRPGRVAWVPVPGEGGASGTVLGFLPAGPGGFEAAARALVLEAARSAGRAPVPGTAGGGAGGGGTAEEGPATDAVQAVFDTLPGPAVLLTPLWSPLTGDVEDYRIDAAAPRSVDHAGRRGAELVGRRVLETYPAVAGTALWHGYAGTLLTGVPYESEPFPYEEAAADAPAPTSWRVRAARLGGRLVVSWSRHYGEAHHEARRRHQMERLGDLGWSEWNVRTGETTWSERTYRIFGRAPGDTPLTWAELPDHVVREDVPRLAEATRRLLREGRPLDRTFRLRTASGVRHLRLVAEPVTDAEGATVEVHALYQDLTALRQAEQALLQSEREVLVQQGLLEAERSLATRLQQALLPRQDGTLTVAGLRTEVFYLPSQAGLNVGGDWYSAIELPDGSGLFVIGDVAGHGIDAVATMAQLRFTAKGMIVTGSPLPDALVRLNALLMHAPEGRHSTATLVLARYRPWDRTLTWAHAGHLPPLLVRGGEARYLTPPPGIMLGATADCSYEEQRLTVVPGDHLLLYTDGLVERPGEDLADGLGRLARRAGGAVRAAGGVERLAVRLTEALSPSRRDDICLLHLTLPADGV